MKTVAFHTLGCKVNQYETEAMEELFKDRGYDLVDSREKSDIYIINTCTVTNMSASKSRQFIRRAKRRNENGIIAVVGCYSQVSPEEIEAISVVDIIIGTKDRGQIVDICENFAENKNRVNVVEDIMDNKEFEDLHIMDLDSKTRAYIKVQDGCNQFCSYCIIPYARGPIRSRPLEDIIDETNRLAESGFKEIILTGIHITSYGKDLDNIDLGTIIEEVAKIKGIERIRLSSMEPTFIDERFMKKVVKTGKLCNHFHLSLQSGSDSVLQRMNRKYSSEEYSKVVDTIRKYMPDAGITTDIIVGFPGETDEEFQETCDFVGKIGFSGIHVFKYSPREGTPASEFEDQIHGTIQQDRSEKLIALAEKLGESFNKKFIGETMEVLFEEESRNDPDYIEAYTRNYIRAKSKISPKYEGEILPIVIENIEDNILIGKLVDNE